MENIKNRTGIDFSKHNILETHFKNDNHNLDVWDLKMPDSNCYHRVRFVNSCGNLTVSGDFGNWVFCREFHPSEDNFVSDMYWSEKLRISSEQTSAKYDSERTEKEIKKLIKGGLKDYGYEDEELRKLKEQFTDLLPYTNDEIEYKYQAFRELNIDYDLIPFCETRHFWLSVIYDAFDEICNRLKLQKSA